LSKSLNNIIATIYFLLIFLLIGNGIAAQQIISRDTITSFAVIYNGDTIEAKELATVFFYSRGHHYEAQRTAAWTRLRNAIYVTYPYAKRAGAVLNDINAKLNAVNNEEQRKRYIKSREAELRKEFTDPLTNLSIYQGKVLMKLINRETGNNCFNIIKEYKGGFTARFYQTVAFFFSSNLKQPYDPSGEDAETEKIVQEVKRMYGI